MYFRVLRHQILFRANWNIKKRCS